ncbi:MAG: transketolase family protein [Ruminiclostridium sp.]
MAEKMTIREAYGKALAKLGELQNNIVVLEADVGSSTRSIIFGDKFPKRYFNVGISEINMVAMASGFALSGFNTFVNTFSVFMTTRGLDPINSLISYDKLNVKLIGNYCGLSDSYDGASHQAIFDISSMRSLPNMTIISPCDQIETEKAVFACGSFDGPVYMRLSRNANPIVFDEAYDYKIGKGVIMKEGTDITIVATGYMVQKALKAAALLEADGINAQVVNIHTIKPIDEQLIISCAKQTGLVLTVEEHSIFGGLGSAVSEVLSQQYPVTMHIMGLTGYAESGDYEKLLSKYQLDEHAIYKNASSIIKQYQQKQKTI